MAAKADTKEVMWPLMMQLGDFCSEQKFGSSEVCRRI